MGKTEKHIVDERIAKIAEMMIHGKTRQEILHFVSLTWHLSKRQGSNYIMDARAFITNDIVKDVRFDFAKAVKRYELLFTKAFEGKDYRLAASVNEKICTLEGLLKNQVEFSGDIQFVCSVPD